MPNGDSHYALPLDVQVKDLMNTVESDRATKWEVLRLLREMIEENKQIRKIAHLPEREYPKEISIKGITHNL